MAKVERYEAKLNVMAYIGLFDELLRGVIPVCLTILIVMLKVKYLL